ncbi:retropepsin-like aspartic protease [Phyllobacterium salinisoli]|nr:retropepsin-like aspartic protease [Phyllobacterium salinisoli]
MKIDGSALLLSFGLCLFPALAGETADQNDLAAFLANRGSVIIPYTLDSGGGMIVDAVLCPTVQKCVGTPFGFDSGDPDNNIGRELTDKLALTGKEKVLDRLYLGGLPPISYFPIYFSEQTLRGSYLGAHWMEKLGLWLDFGAREVYGSVPPGAVEDYMKGSALKYRTFALKSFETYRYITVSINGKEQVNFLVDTGTTGSVIDKNYAQSLGLRFSDKQCTTLGSQIGETRTCFTHDIVSMKAGNQPLSVYLPRGFADLDTSFIVPPLNIKGIVGMEWLERNAVIMSLAENKLYVPVMEGAT